MDKNKDGINRVAKGINSKEYSPLTLPHRVENIN